MATANPIQLVPPTVPNGSTGEIDVTFTLNPGTPDKPVTATLTSDGAAMGTLVGVLQGVPAETLPTVGIGSTGHGWEIQTSAGTLAALGANKFSLHYSMADKPATVTLTHDGATVQTATGLLLGATSGSSSPPPAGGYYPGNWVNGMDFPVGPGQFASLPNDAQAAAMVHRSTWEPRPTNTAANAMRPPVGWTAPPPVSSSNPFPANVWARVTGACPLTGATTDELIQWTAFKWGLPDELIRAEMVQESSWYQDLKWSDSMPANAVSRFGARVAACPVGTWVFGGGYGDPAPFSRPPAPPLNTHGSPNTLPGRQYNQSLGGTLVDSQYSGTRVDGPESFGVPQCRWFANTSPGPTGFGAYPYTELCTSVAMDVYGATIRAQYEGWNSWMHGGYDAYKLAPGGTLGVWGSIGNWFGGDWNAGVPQSQWNTTPTCNYVKAALGFLISKPWLVAGF